MLRIVPGPECGSCHMPPLSLRTLAHSSVESRNRSQIQASVAIQRPTPGSHDFFYRESVFIAHNTTCTTAAHALLFSGFTRGSHRYLATGHTLQREDPASVVAAIQSVSGILE